MSVVNFNRKEQKYALSPAQFGVVSDLVNSHMAKDAFSDTLITSLYFDTPEYLLIGRSMEHPLYKEKLRVRVYSSASEGRVTIEHLKEDQPVFLELKKKYKGIVYKRRVTMTWRAAQSFIQGMDYCEACRAYPLKDANEQHLALSEKEIQVAAEIAAAAARYEGLQPSMYISCVRSAYTSAANTNTTTSDLRITFDKNLAFLDVNSGITGNLLEPGAAVMEIKTSQAYPTWLHEGLTERKIYPQAFSKYGNAYKRVVEIMRAS